MELYMTLCVVLIATLQTGLAVENLKCYSCNSKNDPECAEGDTSKLTSHVTECNNQALESAKNAINSVSKSITNFGSKLGLDVGTAPKIDAKMVCLKAEWTEKDSDKKSVMRSCSLAVSEGQDWCSQVTKSMESQKSTMIGCSQCESDLCNGSANISPSVLPILASVIMFIAFFRQ